MCLKLCKTTEDILEMPYFDAMRKFNTYTAMDELNNARPLIALPAVGKDLAMLGIDTVLDNYKTQQKKFAIEFGFFSEKEVSPEEYKKSGTLPAEKRKDFYEWVQNGYRTRKQALGSPDMINSTRRKKHGSRKKRIKNGGS